MALFDSHKNFAYSTVAVAPVTPTGGTSLTVAAGQGALFPAVPFNAVVWTAGAQPTTLNAEIVRVTAIAGDVFTITRTQESTSARAITVGDQISNNITLKMITDIENAINTVGTWVPVIGGSGGTSGQTYAAQEGRYIKIGSLVWVAFRAALAAKGTITGNVEIQGLPFTAENLILTNYYGVISWDTLATTWVALKISVVQNSTKCAIFGATAASASVNTSLGTADISNTTTLVGALIYRTSV